MTIDLLKLTLHTFTDHGDLHDVCARVFCLLPGSTFLFFVTLFMFICLVQKIAERKESKTGYTPSSNCSNSKAVDLHTPSDFWWPCMCPLAPVSVLAVVNPSQCSASTCTQKLCRKYALIHPYRVNLIVAAVTLIKSYKSWQWLP